MTIPETFPVQPQTEWAPKRWAYDLLKLGLNTVGRLSNGIRIGQTYGFDSGVMLDYVYTNRASGKGIIGRAIDRGFLNSKGWRCIRNRGVLLGLLFTLARLIRSVPHRYAPRQQILILSCRFREA
ncbi:MAG: class I SAM-dependent methyltransferase family protein [Pseudomonadota bacterium]